MGVVGTTAGVRAKAALDYTAVQHHLVFTGDDPALAVGVGSQLDGQVVHGDVCVTNVEAGTSDLQAVVVAAGRVGARMTVGGVNGDGDIV